jgi:hypothetical protein
LWELKSKELKTIQSALKDLEGNNGADEAGEEDDD